MAGVGSISQKHLLPTPLLLTGKDSSIPGCRDLRQAGVLGCPRGRSSTAGLTLTSYCPPFSQKSHPPVLGAGRGPELRRHFSEGSLMCSQPWALRLGHSGSNLKPTTFKVCDLGQVHEHFWVSVSSFTGNPGMIITLT